MVNLKFKVEDGSGGFQKRSWFHRFCARVVARMIVLSGPSGATYQFGGWDGALKKNYLMVDASKFQLAHWILRQVGYECCVADIMERCGVDGELI